MKRKRKGKLLSIWAILISTALSAFFITTMVYLPNNIHFIAGEEQKFSFGLPLSADFSAENIGVLDVNNKPVEGNIHLSLNEEFSIEPKEQGKTDVEISLFGIIPVKTVSVEVIPRTEIIPCGMTVGVTLDTNGVMVLGTGFVNGLGNETFEPAKGLLKSGDLITKAGDTVLNEKEDLITAIENTGGKEITLELKRNGEETSINVVPVLSIEDSTYKLGIWVRDSTQGIGTVTYYNPETNKFGALGHGVYDVDTKQLMSLKRGDITSSDISGVKKGEKGLPGEILGSVNKNDILGEIDKNSAFGLYGVIQNGCENYFPTEKFPIALQQDVHEGEAIIKSNIIGNEVRDYKVNIESINKYSANEDKGMVVKITDEELLNETNGIVQGMSGSPILQDGKLIGAVTHVFVQDPTKGYGIFIENMLKEEEKAVA